MNWLIIALIVYILGASLLNRYRGNGGEWGPNLGHNAKRAIVSAWLSIQFILILDPIYVIPVFALIWGVGFAPGWGLYFDFTYKNEPGGEVTWIDWILAKVDLDPEKNDLVAMSLRGLMFTVPPAAWVTAMTSNPAPLLTSMAGALMGPIYWMFYRLRLPHDRIALAEWAWGVLLALIYLTMGGLCYV